jgi:putative FmdB family regulatory protein
MPIYEYTCRACGRRVSIFFRSVSNVDSNPACPRCCQRQLQRRMSRFWRHAGGSNPGDEPDATFDGGMTSGWDDEYDAGEEDDLDPVAFAREARHMAEAMGEPLDAEFDTALRHIESGADPEDVLGEMDESGSDIKSE